MEFYKKMDQWNLINRDIKIISDKEKSKIIEMFPFRLPNGTKSTTEIGKLYINRAKLIYDIPRKRYLGPLDDRSERKDIEIYIDNDEYYYVKVYSKLKSIVGFIDIKSYYKCDQWQGLIKCIEEKIMVK